ncbi:MAG TPA: hypothetical protein VKB19_09530 [Pedobacter sp.]|nr:hypothetical protein [Pedobacter sp.]
MLPAGTAHISLNHSDDISVVGTYANGTQPDLIEITDLRPAGKVDGVPFPENDPFSVIRARAW